MKKKICTVMLSLCSLIGEAERKSDASIIGKTLKYGSAAVGSLETLCAAFGWCKWLKHIADLKVCDAKEAKNIENQVISPKYEYGYIIQTPYFNIPDIRMFTVGTVLCDLLCYGGYKLGQYLDGDFNKSNANQKKRSSKETVSDKNKISKLEDKNQNLHENSKKSKI